MAGPVPAFSICSAGPGTHRCHGKDRKGCVSQIEKDKAPDGVARGNQAQPRCQAAGKSTRAQAAFPQDSFSQASFSQGSVPQGAFAQGGRPQGCVAQEVSAPNAGSRNDGKGRQIYGRCEAGGETAR